jgi:hypothetical protein
LAGQTIPAQTELSLEIYSIELASIANATVIAIPVETSMKKIRNHESSLDKITDFLGSSDPLAQPLPWAADSIINLEISPINY